jgi:ribosomal protein L32
MRRLEKMDIEKKRIQTCEECGEYVHVHKDCPKEAKVLDYMRKGDLPNFRYG